MAKDVKLKCYVCGNRADYVCANCGKKAICEDEEDEFCPECGSESGFWDEI